MTKHSLTGDQCKCSACGEHFNSTYAFDKHRTGVYAPPGRRRCRTASEMLNIGMAQNAKGFWISHKHTDSSKRRMQSSGLREGGATTPRGTP